MFDSFVSQLFSGKDKMRIYSEEMRIYSEEIAISSEEKKCIKKIAKKCRKKYQK
jgi:hypothetical protein